MTPELIHAEQISVPGFSEPFSCGVETGGMTIVLTPKDEINADIVRVLIGLTTPLSGTVTLFGSPLTTLSEGAVCDARRRIGVAFGTGGLVSNLKVWENLTLALYYHQHLNHADVEVRGMALLKRLGYGQKLMALPGLLTLSQKKLIGTARAMLIDPDVIIYESPLSGLNREEKNSFFRLASEFHREKSGRGSLVLTSSREVLLAFPDAAVVDLIKGQS